jgi:putative ABC transport system ATP-binding protein
MSLLCKTYQMLDTKIEVLKDVSLTVKENQFTAITGSSGSGKTTLLNIIGSIDKPTSGNIIVLENDLSAKNEDFLASFRCHKVGFVFQSYNLVSTLTVAENIAFPMEWVETPKEKIEKRIDELLELLDLQKRKNHFPFQLSGGEQQRVAFARALANNPPLFLADEPTGNLDSKTGGKIIQILQKLKDEGKTIIAATHDKQLLALADKKLYLEDGKLANLNE